ncbi:hypothetical protein B0H11DRAFT_1988040 [Mycena galericulata]|nr:hypothetical protein B0H11DRAFT_1988040 [Mycena galericulata]
MGTVFIFFSFMALKPSLTDGFSSSFFIHHDWALDVNKQTVVVPMSTKSPSEACRLLKPVPCTTCVNVLTQSSQTVWFSTEFENPLQQINVTRRDNQHRRRLRRY